jgi:hypothetical protein
MSQVLPEPPRSANFLGLLTELLAWLRHRGTPGSTPVSDELKADTIKLLATIAVGGNMAREGRTLPQPEEVVGHSLSVWGIAIRIIEINPELSELLNSVETYGAYIDSAAELFSSFLKCFSKLCEPAELNQVEAAELESFKKFVEAFYYASAIDAESRHFEEGGGEY